jgi:hypothetical protein
MFQESFGLGPFSKGPERGVESMNLVSDISNELAIALLVEKRFRERLEDSSAKEFIEKVGIALADKLETDPKAEDRLRDSLGNPLH